MEECYIYEKEASLCEGNNPTICAYIAIVYIVGGDKFCFHISLVEVRKYFQAKCYEGIFFWMTISI